MFGHFKQTAYVSNARGGFLSVDCDLCRGSRRRGIIKGFVNVSGVLCEPRMAESIAIIGM